MRTIRTVAALVVTSPLYLASMLFIRHPFTAEWEDAFCSLFGR
jgi:hypothetical protein